MLPDSDGGVGGGGGGGSGSGENKGILCLYLKGWWRRVVLLSRK